MKETKKRARGNGRMDEAEFFTQAIKTLRNGQSKGIHCRYSGFNEAYRKYYGADPRPAQERLIDAGVITVRPCRGGAMMYLAGEEPEVTDTGTAALAKMGIAS